MFSRTRMTADCPSCHCVALKPALTIVSLQSVPIFQQLEIEEALLRAGSGNWCLFNHGTSPAIVMGLSGKVEETVEEDVEIPVIRRFSGGGTVVVDEDTVFLTLIVDGNDLRCPKNPVDVLAWAGRLLAPAFSPQTLCIEGQDYAIDGQKIGGNAQSFSCRRVLHHTSFLWSWKKERMSLLKLPQRQPKYRRQRSHGEFCTMLSRYFVSKETLVLALKRCLETDFDCKEGGLQQLREVVKKPHRKALQWVRT
jgi:lipoate-protein ligase A